MDSSVTVSRETLSGRGARQGPRGRGRHEGGPNPTRRDCAAHRPRPLVAVVGAALSVLLLATTGCASQEDRDRAAVTRQIQNQVVPALSSSEELGGLTDLRDLQRPNEELRELFDNLFSTPRVIEAESDRAVLAIWRTARAGAEPFNANRSATASACIEIRRTTEGVRAGMLDCPHQLREHEPLRTPVYGPETWARNAEAVAETSYTASSLGQEIRWLLFGNGDGTEPRTEQRSARFFEAALRDRAKSRNNHITRVQVETTDFTQHGETVRGTLVINAEVPDATDVAGTVSATCRYTVEADLTITSAAGNENWIPVRYASC